MAEREWHTACAIVGALAPEHALTSKWTTTRILATTTVKYMTSKRSCALYIRSVLQLKIPKD